MPRVPGVDQAAVPEGTVPEVKPRWRGASHAGAAIVFPAMGAVLVAVAHSTAARWAALVYTVAVTGMYVTSACYHRGNWSPSVRRRLRQCRRRRSHQLRAMRHARL